MSAGRAGLAAVAAAAALLGAGSYLLIAGPDAPAPAAETAAEPAATRPEPPAAAQPAAAGGAGGFQFASPRAPADDIAEVRFVDGEGLERSLAEFRGRGILLNVWATWCGPCREEMPTLDRLQERLGSERFEVVALSIDRDGLAPVREFYDELGLEALRTYVDATGAATILLEVLGLPSTLLIDAEGRELGRYVGPAHWDSDEVVEAIRRALDLPASPPASSAAASPPPNLNQETR